MIVHEKNTGTNVPKTYVSYVLDGTVLSFGGGALRLDLAELEQDWRVKLDISADETGALVLGPAWRYAAQLDLPARTYEILKGKADDFSFPQLTKVAAPLNTDAVELMLWNLEV